MILLRLYFHGVEKTLKTTIHTNFCPEWVLGLVIDYAWISKPLRDEAFTWPPRELSCWLKKWFTVDNLAVWTVLILEIVLFSCFWVTWEIKSRLCSKTQWLMFLLVSGRHVLCPFGWARAWRLHTNHQIWVKKFSDISCIRQIAVTWILARGFTYLPSFFFQILDFIYWTVFVFISMEFFLKSSNCHKYLAGRLQCETV